MLRSSFFRLVRNHLSHSFSTAKESPVIFQYKKHGVKVILNKPKALNALDLEMIRILKPEVDKWNQEGKIKVCN